MGDHDHHGKKVGHATKVAADCCRVPTSSAAGEPQGGSDHAHATTPSAATTPSSAATATLYTCPMHPEVESPRPGSCPKCGMALEPREPVAEEEAPNHELRDMSRRFWISLLPTAVLFVLAMGDMLGDSGGAMYAGKDSGAAAPHSTTSLLSWLQLLLATPVVLWGGWPFFQRGWDSIKNRSPNMFTLIALGTGVAFTYSTAALFLTSLHLYFEAAAVITTLVLLGQVLELKARSRTSQAIRGLLGLAPKTARVIRDDDTEEDIPLAHVHVGNLLRVRPGEKVPVDGVILEGSGVLDESMVTGEPIPAGKNPKDRVIGGTINRSGSFILRAEKVGRDTLLARIVAMVAQAQRSRAPIQRLADTVSAYFVPAVVLVAAVTAIAWGLAGPEPRWLHALVNAVAVLIIACPCALGLATPMAIMVGTGRGATAGVLIRDAEALETLERIDTLIVDKTGTLTEGRPSLVDVVTAPGWERERALRLAASLEQGSEHPLGEAIVRAAREEGMTLERPADFHAVSGKGVTGIVGGMNLALGSSVFLEDFTGRGHEPDDANRESELLRRSSTYLAQGQTVVHLAAGGASAAFFAIADAIKATTPAALEALRADGVRVVMLTGDNPKTAEAVAQKLGITEYHAGVLPHQKQEWVRRLQSEGRTVAMAGDGINDAPALAQAHVGIAMGTGTDIAMESAGVTLVKGDLRGLARARRLSRATMRNIRQNLFFAFGYNALCVPIAAGALYPFTGLLLNPMIAAAAMSFSSVSVIGNSLRLRRARLDV